MGGGKIFTNLMKIVCADPFLVLYCSFQAGYMAIPSPRQPKPGTDKYYRGGYITQVMIAMDAKHQ